MPIFNNWSGIPYTFEVSSTGKLQGGVSYMGNLTGAGLRVVSSPASRIAAVGTVVNPKNNKSEIFLSQFDSNGNSNGLGCLEKLETIAESEINLTSKPWAIIGKSVIVGKSVGVYQSNVLLDARFHCVSSCLPISPIVRHISCYQENDGAIELLVEGGTAPYTFLWNHGSTRSKLYNLSAGDYSVTVTDANSFSVATTITIDEPQEFNIEVSEEQTICIGESVQLTAEFVEGVTYQWKRWGTTISNTANVIINPIETATYTLTATNERGCEAVEFVTVMVDESKNCCVDDSIVINRYTEIIPSDINSRAITIAQGVSIVATDSVSYDFKPMACDTTEASKKPNRFSLFPYKASYKVF